MRVNLDDILEQYLPSGEDIARRVTAVDHLQQMLTSNEQLHDIVLAPLGSYAMGTYFASSDVDVLVITSVLPRDFYPLALSILRASEELGAGSPKLVNSLVPVIEVTILGIKFDIQCCQAAPLLKNTRGSATGASLVVTTLDADLVAGLSPDSLRPLNSFRDTAYIRDTVPDVDAYRAAHRFLSLYLKGRGLYAAKFGYLGGIHLSLMLNHVVKLLALYSGKKTSISAASIVRSFLVYFSSFNWSGDVVSDPALHEGQQYPRSSREPVVILALHTPTARPNVASSCTKMTCDALKLEFAIAAEQLANGDWAWCLRDKVEVASEFLQEFGACIKISLDVWNTDEVGSDKVREILGSVESKIPLLQVNLARLDGVYGRVWPARFCESAGLHNEGDGTQFKGSYLIGVSAKNDHLDAEAKKLVEGNILSVVRSFELSLRESKALSADCSYVDVSILSRKKILAQALGLDNRDWTGLAAPLVDDREDDGVGDDDVSQTVSNVPSSSASRSRSSSKLRPAQDILSRLRWDGSLSADNYMVGYEDRFLGVREMPLAKWKADQTDLEFIPMHRIVWVREVDSGDLVWDRKNRIDKVCGSGK